MDFIFFSCTTSQVNAKVIGEKIFCHTFVMLLPYRVKVSRHKSNTFHTNISTLHMFISITFTKTSIDETNKTQQKVRRSKFMFTMSTIPVNTCIQTTTPLHNHWFRWQCLVLVLHNCTSWNQGLRSTVTITGIQFCWICFCRIFALFSGITTFFSKMGPGTSCTWHCYHAAERRQSLSLQRCGHLIRQIWIRWTTASGVCFKRGSTALGSMMWRSWKNVCWGSGGCWTTPSSR